MPQRIRHEAVASWTTRIRMLPILHGGLPSRALVDGVSAVHFRRRDTAPAAPVDIPPNLTLRTPCKRSVRSFQGMQKKLVQLEHLGFAGVCKFRCMFPRHRGVLV